MNILDGKLISGKIIDDISINIKQNIIDSSSRLGYEIGVPSIAIVLVGSNPASESYVKNKVRACDRAGIKHHLIKFEESVSNYDLLNEIYKLNNSSFDGFIIQLPLPKHIDTERIINEIDPLKDIDGFHPINFGKMALGQKSMRPATAYGILKLIQSYDIDTNSKHVVVIGRSNIVGKPISIMLGNDFNVGRATVTSCDINTPRSLLIEESRRADIIIIAVGIPGFLTPDMVKENVIVIDVGINRLESGKLVGDCDFDGVSKKASWITPVPGGVGPMTIAGLILNTYESWKIKNLIHD